MKELTQNNKKLIATYSNFEDIHGSLFPFKVGYEVEAESPVEVKVKYTKIVLNEPLKFPFKIPSKYSPAK